MTYYVFSGTLNPTRSQPALPHGTKYERNIYTALNSWQMVSLIYRTEPWTEKNN